MCEPSPRRRRRVFFYVDGFNLYHRRLEKNPQFKWLCLKTLAQCHFPDDEIVAVKFFTAKVDSQQDAPSQKQLRQTAYWDVLRHTGVQVIEGLLEPRERECRAVVCNKREKFWTRSEKMSDVNLALHIYRDFLTEHPDVIAVLTGDLDVIPALRMVRETKKRVYINVILPTDDDGLLFSRLPEHYQVARTSRLSEVFLKKSLLAERINVGSASVEDWRGCPDTWR